jgi:hypothetical protein
VFYGYYCDYDWVTFSWIFGKMIDLPNGFPMYCIDLKQILDEKANSLKGRVFMDIIEKAKTSHNYNNVDFDKMKFEEKLKYLKGFKTYPKQENEHNALSDAHWNLQLFKFLEIL